MLKSLLPFQTDRMQHKKKPTATTCHVTCDITAVYHIHPELANLNQCDLNH